VQLQLKLDTATARQVLPNTPLQRRHLSSVRLGKTSPGSITVTITDADPTATMYYTFAGNKPEVTSILYTGPITATRSEFIQAIAVVHNEAVSAVAGQVYTLVKK
jgi:hypothetical protein